MFPALAFSAKAFFLFFFTLIHSILATRNKIGLYKHNFFRYNFIR